MKLAFDVAGDGPDVVIAHGLFGSKSNWRSIVRKLQDRFRVYTVDLRNHGDSPHAESMTYEDMADDLKVFIDAHCEGRASVVGHSMGGKAMMALALWSPASVERLAVVDVAPVAYRLSGVFSGFIDAMLEMDLDAVTNRSDADRQLAETISEPPIRAFLLQNLRLEDGAWGWRINLGALKASLKTVRDFEFVGRFDGPTLFLRGGDSDYFTDAMESTARALFPRMTLKTIAGTGHWVHAQKPEAVVEALGEFLSG